MGRGRVVNGFSSINLVTNLLRLLRARDLIYVQYRPSEMKILSAYKVKKLSQLKLIACLICGISSAQIFPLSASGQTATVQSVAAKLGTVQSPITQSPISQSTPVQEASVLLACATCGCNELCPISVMEDTTGGRGGSSLTDSIWGNMTPENGLRSRP